MKKQKWREKKEWERMLFEAEVRKSNRISREKKSQKIRLKEKRQRVLKKQENKKLLNNAANKVLFFYTCNMNEKYMQKGWINTRNQNWMEKFFMKE